METGLLNFHDEEHFPVFCEESSEFINDNSIFDSFVDFGDEGSSWVIPESSGLEFNLTSTNEIKEDYQKTIQDWQQHISNLQVRENDTKDESSILTDPFEDIPDIFGSDISIPLESTEVPKKEEVHTYKVAKRKGLVIKLTKKKNNDCDKITNSKHKRVENSGKHKKKVHSSSVNKSVKLPVPELLPISKSENKKIVEKEIKTEPLDDFGLPSNELEQAVANIEFIQSDDFSSFSSAYDFDGQHADFSEFSQPVVNNIELEQAVANIEIKQEEIPENFIVKNTINGNINAAKSSISQNSSSDNNIELNSLPQIKIEEEDYFTVENNVKSEENDALLDIKCELASPFNDSFSSPQSGVCNNYFRSETTNDEHIDVEKVDSGPTPILEAGDMTSLLNQFESSSSVNKAQLESVDFHNKKMLSSQKKTPINSEQKHNPALKLSTKTILEALPKEVIDRIKESSKRNKKSVPVVPAERLPKKGSESLKDAGATPAKAQRIMTNNIRRSGESVKLDHDYCTIQGQQKEKTGKRVPSKEEVEFGPAPGEWEKKWDSKKDSGLESGDVSDASETLERSRGKSSPCAPPSSSEAIVIKEENQVSPEPGEIIEEEPKKKKLNLEEYRNRRKNVTPKSPVKSRTNGWNLQSTVPATNESDASSTGQKVNAEVQVKIDDPKTEVNNEKSVGRRSPLIDRLRRRSSSSSSSSVSKSRYLRRGRSKKRRQSKRSHRSRSRSRSCSESRSHSRSRSRSRSHSRSSSCSYSSSSSRSRSRSRGRSRRTHRSRSSYRRSSSHRYSSRSHKGRFNFKRSDDWSPVEKMRQVEERRVIYVGRLEEGTTRAQLRERFAMFGPIIDISLHFREKGDNYGFVTFAYKADAYEAVERGNDNPYQPKYDICFGGRRAFCKQRYSDLDGASPQSYSPHQQNSRSFDTFDRLLREAQKKLKKSNHV